MEEKKAQIPAQTTINAGTVIGSTFAHLANVSVTDNDITLEFVFINPRDPSTGQVVSRVTMPRANGLELGNIIKIASQMQENKKGGKQNG